MVEFCFIFVQNALASSFTWCDLCSYPFLEGSREDLSNDMTDSSFINGSKGKKSWSSLHICSKRSFELIFMDGLNRPKR